MKKIIAISVMFALIAGAVFADTALAGAVEARFSLAKQVQWPDETKKGNQATTGGEDTPAPVMGGSIGAAQIRLSGSNTEGTLSGLFNFRNTDTVRSTTWIHRVFVNWKPIEQVKVFLGIENDGLFDTADFLGWGFHQGDNDYLFTHHWDFWRQLFPGNWDGFGLALSFYPMPGLDINLVFPTGGINWPQATNAQISADREITNGKNATGDEVYNGMIPGRLRLTGNYSLDFGKISFAYIGGVAAKEKGTTVAGTLTDDNNGLVGLSALITAVEGLAIKVGGSVYLNGTNGKGTAAEYAVPMIINGGLGVAYAGEGFGVKARFGMISQAEPSKGADDVMFITGNVMPYFAVGEKGQVLIDIGVSNDSRAKDHEMGWYVTPAYRLSMEGGAFKIGLQVYSNINLGGNIGVIGNVIDDTSKAHKYYGDDIVRWNIPMLLAFNF
jgi:hypothetical protein